MLLNRLNRWTANRLKSLRDQRRGRMTITNNGITIQHNNKIQMVPWSAIEQIIATTQEAYIGIVIGLTVIADNAQTAHASEHDPEWQDLIDGIATHLSGCIPYARWALELTTGTTNNVQVFSRFTYPDL